MYSECASAPNMHSMPIDYNSHYTCNLLFNLNNVRCISEKSITTNARDTSSKKNTFTVHGVGYHVLEVAGFLCEKKCENLLIVTYGPPFCSEFLGADQLSSHNYLYTTSKNKKSDYVDGYFTPPIHTEALQSPLLKKHGKNNFDTIFYVNHVHLDKNGKRCGEKEFSVLILPPLFIDNMLRLNCDYISHVAKTFNHDGILIDLSLQKDVLLSLKSNIKQELIRTFKNGDHSVKHFTFSFGFGKKSDVEKFMHSFDACQCNIL